MSSLLSEIGQEIIDNGHPRVASTLSIIEIEMESHNTKKHDRDLVCAVLNKAGVMTPFTYSRMRRINHNILLSQIISICVFWGLDFDRASQLITAAGYALRIGNKTHDLYAFLIQESHNEAVNASCPKHGDLKYHGLMDECNRFLIEKGITNVSALLGIQRKKIAE